MRNFAPLWCSFKESLAGPLGSTCVRVTCQSPTSSRNGTGSVLLSHFVLGWASPQCGHGNRFLDKAAGDVGSHRPLQSEVCKAAFHGSRGHREKPHVVLPSQSQSTTRLCLKPLSLPSRGPRHHGAATHPSCSTPSKVRPTESRSIEITGVPGCQDMDDVLCSSGNGNTAHPRFPETSLFSYDKFPYSTYAAEVTTVTSILRHLTKDLLWSVT